MLTVTSTVTMQSGSTFQESIAGTVQASATTPIGAYGYYSLLNVSGGSQFVIGSNVTLAPMMRNIFTSTEAGYTSPAFVPSLGQTFRAVTAEGGITGRFSTLTQPDGMADGTRMAVFYNVFGSNSIDLRVLPSSYALWLRASNGNTRSVARALDQILNVDQAGTATTAQDQLLYLTAGNNATDLPGFVSALAGEVHGALAAVQPQAGQWLQGSVARHLSSQGTGVSSVAGTTGADDVAGVNQQSALWIDLDSSKTNWSADRMSTSFASDRTQYTLGMDALSQGDNRLGFGISHTNTSVTAEKGAGAVDGVMSFVYGQWSQDRYLFDGLAGYGTNKATSQRIDPTGLTSALSSSQEGTNSLVSIGVRTSSEFDGTVIEPFARVMWQQNTRKAFSEGSSVAALSFADFSATGVRSLVGLSVNSKMKDPLAASSTYQFGIAVGQDTGELAHPTVQASLAGVNTTISSPEFGTTFVQANASVTGRIDRKTFVYAGMTGESSTGKSDLGVNLGLRMKF